MSFLRLIRFPNLLIVALTQWLLYDRIILSALDLQQLTPTLPSEQFHLFVLVTVLITAGGYVINDIVDVRTDLLNKPQQIIIGRRISSSTAYWLYFCFNLAGFVVALYLAFVGDRMSLLFLFPTAVVGLLAYSIFFKKRALIGNVLISAYCAGVALIVWLAELPSLNELSGMSLSRVTQLLTYYAVFAFFSTLFREIVKDLEDVPGDRAIGARTAPIVWGTQAAKQWAGGAGILLLGYLVYFFYRFSAQLIPTGKIALLLLIIMIAMACGMLIRAKAIKDYHRLSQFMKIIMLWGVLLLFVL